MNPSQPILIGYFARRAWIKQEDGPRVLPPQVEEMCNVGRMNYEGPPKWVDLWLHKEFWLYDKEDQAWATVIDNTNLHRLRTELSRRWDGIRGSIQTAMDQYIARHDPITEAWLNAPVAEKGWELYAYRIFPFRYADGVEATYAIQAREVQALPSDYERLGLDVVSRKGEQMFCHSPLDCNGWYSEVAVNRYCLVDEMETARSLALHWSQDKYDENGSYIGPAEPGPYYIIEVLRKKKALGTFRDPKPYIMKNAKCHRLVGGNIALWLALTLTWHAVAADSAASATTAVFIAAQTDDAETLRQLLEANPRLIEQRGEDGATPLAYAAKFCATNALRLLLAKGAAVDATNRAGWTPLLESAAQGCRPNVATLLVAGADPNHSDRHGQTALICAAGRDDVEIGKLLLAKKARMDFATQVLKTTPLQQAALLGNADFVELLLSQGARTDCRDANGLTPLHAAASGLTLAKLLQSWNSSLQDLSQQTSRDQNLAAIASLASNQMSGLIGHMADRLQHSSAQHRRVAELLLSHGADLEATNSAGGTPLLSAAFVTNLPVAEVLVAHHANLNPIGQRGLTPLAAAALNGNPAMVSLLLDAGADPDIRDGSGFTALNTAAEQGHAEVVKALLAHHANLNLACPNGQTAMHSAANQGDTEILRLLLDQGAELHSINASGTPLACAVENQHLEAVKFLLERGAKNEVVSPQNGMTPLHWAATLGNPAMIKLLLDAGAAVDPESSWQGTPLNAAAAGRRGTLKWLASIQAQILAGFKPMIFVPGSDQDFDAGLRILLAAKANVNARAPQNQRTPVFTAASQGNVPALDELIAAGADLKVGDQFGLTPLHAASEVEGPATVLSNIVVHLLAAGANLEARDQFRGTPLHAAANNGRPVMVNLLLTAGARVNAVGPNFCTPLQFAVMHGNREIAEMLLAKNADTEWRNAAGTGALHLAAQLQSREMVALLLNHGADVEAGTTNGATALMVSADNGDLATMKLLFDHDAKVNATTRNGSTALLIAAQAGKVEAAQLLLERGANFKVTDMDGFTPLIIAARGGHLAMVKFLLERGANIDAKNNFGFSALHEAADRGHSELLEYLLSRGMNLEQSDIYEATPMHLAANGAFASEARYMAVINVLLARHANINARMRSSQTPLHRAAYFGHPQIVRALLDAGADASLRDDQGRTPLDLAKIPASKQYPGVDSGRKECAKVLLDHWAKSTRQP